MAYSHFFIYIIATKSVIKIPRSEVFTPSNLVILIVIFLFWLLKNTVMLSSFVVVSELFKPTSTGKTVSGYLEYDGRIVKVESLDVIKRFIAEVEYEQNTPSK